MTFKLLEKALILLRAWTFYYNDLTGKVNPPDEETKTFIVKAEGNDL